MTSTLGTNGRRRQEDGLTVDAGNPPVPGRASPLEASRHVTRRGPAGPSGTADTVTTMALRVAFADDNYLVREGVSALLAEVEDIEVVDTAADPHSLLKSVAENSPDAVLTDIRMPPTQTNEVRAGDVLLCCASTSLPSAGETGHRGRAESRARPASSPRAGPTAGR